MQQTIFLEIIAPDISWIFEVNIEYPLSRKVIKNTKPPQMVNHFAGIWYLSSIFISFPRVRSELPRY